METDLPSFTRIDDGGVRTGTGTNIGLNHATRCMQIYTGIATRF